MPGQIVQVPLSDPQFKISLVFLHKGKNAGPFSYLQSARQGAHKALGQDLEETAVARTYNATLFKYKQQLCQRCLWSRRLNTIAPE
jgi:hypothetical protein